MRLLVLGGSSFVGRALVEAGLARGWKVTTFNRGTRAPVSGAVEATTGDRLAIESLEPLAARQWDVVADTWSGAPRAVQASASILAGRAKHYVYISSVSVYAPPPRPGDDEATPTVDAEPDSSGGDYPARKRGAELAVVDAFGDRALLARAGLILGPYEDVGRLPWWLQRVAAGGEILAPGPSDLSLQFIDARDLAGFVLDAAAAGHGGACNVASRPGHATMRSLLDACLRVAGGPDAHLTWVDPGDLLEAGVEPWTELPIWLPPASEFSALHAVGADRAHALGLACRPVEQTVADTWAWLSALDGPPRLRSDLPAPGLALERERAILAAHASRTRSGRWSDSVPASSREESPPAAP